MKRLMIAILFIITAILPAGIHAVDNSFKQEGGHGLLDCDDQTSMHDSKQQSDDVDKMGESAFRAYVEDCFFFLLLKWVAVKDFVGDRKSAALKKVRQWLKMVCSEKIE